MKVNVMHVDGTLLCMRKVHYSHVCRAPKSVHEVEGEKEDAIFLGSITTDGEPWTVNTGIHDSSVTFKIDRGADVTVLPRAGFLEIYKNNPPILRKST